MTTNSNKHTKNKKECQRSDILRYSGCPRGSFRYLLKTTGIKPLRANYKDKIYTNIYPIELLIAAIEKYGSRNGGKYE